MKVLLLLDSYEGGSGSFVRTLADKRWGLPSRGIEVKVLGLQQPRFGQQASEVTTFYQIAQSERQPLLGMMVLGLIKQMLWVGWYLMRKQPDVVITIDTRCVLIVETLRWMGGDRFRSIHTIQNNLREVYRNRKRKGIRHKFNHWLMRWYLNRSKSVVCMSDGLSQAIQTYYSLKRLPKTIYNGIVIKPAKKHTVKSGKGQIIMTACRLDEQKDVLVLVKAFAQVIKQLPHLKLLLVGDGPQKKIIQAECKKLKIDKFIEMPGWVENIEKYYEKATLFVLASKWEGLSFVLIEAMSAGLPVIASDCDFGPREILDKGKYGWLFQVGNEKQLAEIIIKMLNNPALLDKYALKAKDRVQLFSVDRQITQFTELLYTDRG